MFQTFLCYYKYAATESMSAGRRKNKDPAGLQAEKRHKTGCVYSINKTARCLK